MSSSKGGGAGVRRSACYAWPILGTRYKQTILF
ncbi:Uncharacterised protein [Bordetella pertussis]|nr:Uncharacterised protein [Bordetella pertussis]